jgi:hypothetical protein
LEQVEEAVGEEEPIPLPIQVVEEEAVELEKLYIAILLPLRPPRYYVVSSVL